MDVAASEDGEKVFPRQRLYLALHEVDSLVLERRRPVRVRHQMTGKVLADHQFLSEGKSYRMLSKRGKLPYSPEEKRHYVQKSSKENESLLSHGLKFYHRLDLTKYSKKMNHSCPPTSGQTKQNVGRNTETETSATKKAEISADTLFRPK